jgi:hypothetical protein
MLVPAGAFHLRRRACTERRAFGSSTRSCRPQHCIRGLCSTRCPCWSPSPSRDGHVLRWSATASHRPRSGSFNGCRAYVSGLLPAAVDTAPRQRFTVAVVLQPQSTTARCWRVSRQRPRDNRPRSRTEVDVNSLTLHCTRTTVSLSPGFLNRPCVFASADRCCSSRRQHHHSPHHRRHATAPVDRGSFAGTFHDDEAGCCPLPGSD